MRGAFQRQRNLSDELFIFSLRFAEAPVEIKQLSSLLVKVLGAIHVGLVLWFRSAGYIFGYILGRKLSHF